MTTAQPPSPRTIGLIFTAIAAFFGFIVFATGAGLTYASYQEASQGTAATAVITEFKSSTRFTASQNGGSTTRKSYTVTEPIVDFTDANGTAHTATLNRDRDNLGLSIGDEISITYNPDTPSEIRLDDWYGRWGMWPFLMIFGAVFMAISPVFGFIVRRAMAKAA